MLFPNVSVSTKTGLENVENVMKWKKGFYMMTIKKKIQQIYIYFFYHILAAMLVKSEPI